MQATGIVFKLQDNRIGIKLDSIGFKVGDKVTIWDGNIRSLKANNYYWCFLSWVVKPSGGNLFSEGCLSPVDLHEDLKSYAAIETTTNLDNKEFSDYIEMCKVVIGKEYQIDISIFDEIHGCYTG